MRNIFFPILFLVGIFFSTQATSVQQNQNPLTKEEKDMKDKLQITDTVVGQGPVAEKGDLVEVHYTGTLLDGQKFDSSHDRHQTFSFKVGEGRVIKGWDEGIPGMKVGGHRQLTIPSEMGYGSRGAGASIPPNSTLKFDVELVSIKGK